MRNFTLSAAAVLLSMTAYAADAQNITVDHQPDQQKVFVTFEDNAVVLPSLFLGMYDSTATLNDDDVTFYIYPQLTADEDFTNTIYFDYMIYFPALMNGGALADGEYTLTFNTGFLNFDYATFNEEPITVNFTVGGTTGISTIENGTSTEAYNLQGQKVNGQRGFSIVNGKKILVK